MPIFEVFAKQLRTFWTCSYVVLCTTSSVGPTCLLFFMQIKFHDCNIVKGSYRPLFWWAFLPQQKGGVLNCGLRVAGRGPCQLRAAGCWLLLFVIAQWPSDAHICDQTNIKQLGHSQNDVLQTSVKPGFELKCDCVTWYFSVNLIPSRVKTLKSTPKKIQHVLNVIIVSLCLGNHQAIMAQNQEGQWRNKVFQQGLSPKFQSQEKQSIFWVPAC